MVATTPRYVTRALFKTALHRELPSRYDSTLDLLLVSTEAAIDDTANRTFDPAPADPTAQTFDLPAGSIAYLPDALSVTAVRVRGNALTSDEWALLPKRHERDWTRLQRHDAPTGAPLAWGDPWPDAGRGGLEVTARWGFAAVVPACVVDATLRGAITQYQQQPFLFVDTPADEGDVIGAGEPPAVQLTPAVRELLAPVTRPPLEDVV